MPRVLNGFHSRINSSRRLHKWRKSRTSDLWLTVYWWSPSRKIVLPETAKEKPQEGVVLAAGPGRLMDDGTRAPMEVKVKDRVLYAKYAGTELKRDDKKYLILGEKDILAVLK